MKRLLHALALLTALLCLLAASGGRGADTKDLMIGKITGGEQATSAPPYAVAAHALVGQDNSIAVNAWSGSLVFQGATFDAFTTTFVITDPTADRTITFPNSSGTVRVAQASTTTALTADNQVVTPGGAGVLQLTSNNATATNRTFALSATGAVTGAVYVLIGPATLFVDSQQIICDNGPYKLYRIVNAQDTDDFDYFLDPPFYAHGKRLGCDGKAGRSMRTVALNCRPL